MTFDFSGWDERERRQREQAAAAAVRARAALPAAARLCAAHGARETWLFGSLAWGGFGPHSDVDLAVAGVPAGEQTALWSALERLLGRDVDLVDLSAAPETFAARIRAEGEALSAPASDAAALSVARGPSP